MALSNTSHDSRLQGLMRRPSRGSATVSIEHDGVPASLRSSLYPILRVASLIEDHNPRVAYLCRSYALEKAHRLDASSTGRGVLQFTTSLTQRLERDNASSLAARVNKTDEREVESYYRNFYEKYARALDQGDLADSHQIAETGRVVYEVLMAVKESSKVEKLAEGELALLSYQLKNMTKLLQTLGAFSAAGILSPPGGYQDGSPGGYQDGFVRFRHVISYKAYFIAANSALLTSLIGAIYLTAFLPRNAETCRRVTRWGWWFIMLSAILFLSALVCGVWTIVPLKEHNQLSFIPIYASVFAVIKLVASAVAANSANRA